MKKIIYIFIIFITMNFAVTAQVAINKDGSVPSTGAILDVKDATGHHFFVDDATGNVGIGTVLPSEKLEVSGNTKVTGNIEAGGDITATGDVTANGDLWGDNAYITTNAEVSERLLVGGASAGVRQAAIKAGTGRLGLAIDSDDDTYASLYLNNTGGGPAIYAYKGNVELNDGEVNRAAQGSADLIPIAYGIVKYDGTILNAGTGNWSVNHIGTGKYDIEITSVTYNSNSFLTQITPRFLSSNTTSNDVRIPTFGVINSGKLRVNIKDGDGDFKNTTFHFIIYNEPQPEN